MHGPLKQGVVRVDGLGHGLEGVLLSRDAHVVGRHEPQEGQHGRAPVALLGLAEEGDQGGVRLGQAQGVELPLIALVVHAARAGGGARGEGGSELAPHGVPEWFLP